MPNSNDLQDQGRKANGFPSEKPILSKPRKIAIAVSIAIVIVLCLAFAGQIWRNYVLMLQ